jgi:hypothetical protein
MKLLQDIIDSALDDASSLAGLLRKCLVLADDLSNEKLRDWCLLELNGYGKEAELPDYRGGFYAESLGAFFGPGGNVLNDQPLSMHVIDPKHREALSGAEFRLGISEISGLAASSSSTGALQQSWPAHLIVHYQTSFAKGWVLNRAWKVVPISWPIGICDTVRTRILQFALELRKATGDAASPLERMTANEVEKTVTNIILGGQNVIGSTVHGGVAQAGQTAVLQGDIASLANSLRGIGVRDPEIEELQGALSEDQGFGERVKSWVARVSASIGGAATTQVITAAVLAYLGLS